MCLSPYGQGRQSRVCADLGYRFSAPEGKADNFTGVTVVTNPHLTIVSLLTALVLSLSTISGCGSPTPPPEEPEPFVLSYAEALQIYNQELMALDRLKAERDRLKQSLTPDASELVGGLLEQTDAARAELQGALEDLGAVPEQPETDESAAQDDPLAALGQQLNQAREEREQQREEVVRRIAELDQEIAEQEKRVERAKADKEAAEAARK
jgi:hypothetical protein